MIKSLNHNGVYIEYDLDLPPVFSHSYPLYQMSAGKQEAPHNISYFEKLMSVDFSALPIGMKADVSGLYSLMNMNYHINNGGIDQYFSNGYHLNKYSPGELIPHRDKSVQSCFLLKLISFLSEFDDFSKAMEPMTEVQRYFGEANVLHVPSEEDEQELIEVYEYKAGFDRLYSGVSSVLEWGMELYAQYLIKALGEAGHE